MKNILIAMTAAAMLSSGGAWGGFYSGNDIIESCENQTELCKVFMAGVGDTVEILMRSGHKPPPVMKSCIPESATTTQLARVMAKFLNDYPASLTDQASGMAMVALARAFPCE